MEDFIAVLRAFLLSAHWADDSVAGIQAIEDSIEAFFIKLQTSLVLFYNQLFWGEKDNRKETEQQQNTSDIRYWFQTVLKHTWSCCGDAGWGSPLLLSFLL